MKKRYVVELSEDEREGLKRLISRGSAKARMLNRARILLKADTGEYSEGEALTDKDIARMLETSAATVGRVRTRFFGQGLEAALERSAPDRVYERSLDGRAEARLIALACSDPPSGRDRWSLRLLADKAVELGAVESLSHETVRKTLKKRAQTPPGKGMGHPAQRERPVCLADGGCPRPLRRTLRSLQASSLLRREALPAHGPHTRPFAHGRRPACARGPRVRAKGHGAPVHGLQAPWRVALGGGAQKAQKRGVRSGHSPASRGGLPGG